MNNLFKFIKENKKTHLVFDLDETILELVLPWDTWEKRIERKLTEIDPDILKDYKSGKLSLNQLQNLYAKRGNGIKHLLDEHNHYFEKNHLKEIILNEKLIKFITNQNNCKFYIWTSNSQNMARHSLEKAGILDKFLKIVSCESVEQLKPEADGFDLIWDHKTPKEQYLFIGDSQNDESAAKKAGIEFININKYEI